MPQVWAFHISQMMIAVRATGHCSVCSAAPAAFVRRRARRVNVPGTLGRLGSTARCGDCAAAASIIAAGIVRSKVLLSTRLISKSSISGRFASWFVRFPVIPEIIEDTNEVAVRVGGHKFVQLPRFVFGLGDDLRLRGLPL